MFLPVRSKNPPESRPVGAIGLLILNVLVFALTVDGDLHVRKDALTLFGLASNHVTPLNLFGHMFLHTNLLHLAGNMWFLYLFGFAVEGRLRTKKFLLLYLLSGLVGALLQISFTAAVGSPSVLLGASGAIMGVLGAALYLFPYSQVQFLNPVPPFGTTTWTMVWVAAYYLGLDVIFSFLAGTHSSVAHFAHLGGAAGGLIFCLVLRPARDTRRTSEAKATYSETKDIALVSSQELASMAQVAPTNTTLVLNWMQRNIRDGQVRPECLAVFLDLLPAIIDKEPAPDVGFVLASVCAISEQVPASQVMRVGRLLEDSDEPKVALRLYDYVLRNRNSTSIDLEAALFRTAFLCERTNNRQKAASTYHQLIERYPMSPLASQARVRLQFVAR